MFGSTGIGGIFGRATGGGATNAELTTVYVLVIIFLVLAAVMWVMICVDMPGWFAAVMFSMTVAVMIETILRRHDVTQNSIDVAISLLIFGLLLIVLWNAGVILIGAVCVFIAYLTYNWTHELALQILLPTLVIIASVIALYVSTKNVWQFCYQVLASFTSAWVLVYGTLFLKDHGDLTNIDFAAHDLLAGPMCFADRDCAWRVSAVVGIACIRIVAVLAKRCTDGCSCAFCWGDEDALASEQKRRLLADSVGIMTMIQQQQQQQKQTATASTAPKTIAT